MKLYIPLYSRHDEQCHMEIHAEIDATGAMMIHAWERNSANNHNDTSTLYLPTDAARALHDALATIYATPKEQS